jgi:hypothetical protein
VRRALAILGPAIALAAALMPLPAQSLTSPRVPFTIAPRGSHPSVLVDQVGTAHVVWNEEVAGGADRLHYCQVPRGVAHCTNNQVMVPPDGEAQFNNDYAGPRIVELGPDQLILLTPRYPNVVTVDTQTGRVDPNCFENHPQDGGTRCFGASQKIWAFRSDDGGASFDDPYVISHSEDASGGAAAFGPEGARKVAMIGDTPNFQEVAPGGYTHSFAYLGDEGSNRNYHGSLGFLSGGRPVAAFSDLARTYYRVWRGGPYNAVSSWGSTHDLGAGDEPRLTSGPRGLFLMNRIFLEGGKYQYVVRHYAGTSFGAPHPVSPQGQPVNRDMFEDPGGHLHAAYVERSSESSGDFDTLQYRLSVNDGVNWSTPLRLSRSAPYHTWNVHLGAAEDGGGLAVWQTEQSDDGAVKAVSFGSRQPLYDVRTTGIEVTQGIQGFNLPVRNQSHPNADVPYHGVELEYQGKTVARVYADAKTKLPFNPLNQLRGRGPPVAVLLYGFRGGRPLPGGPLTAEAGPTKLDLGGPFDITAAQRARAGAAYTFTLPWSWTSDAVTLRAVVNPPGTSPSLHECGSCGANNAFTLTGVRFRRTGSARFFPLAIKVNDRLPIRYPDSGPIFDKADAVTPLHFEVNPYFGVLDMTDLTHISSVTVSKCFVGVFPCSSETLTSADDIDKYRRILSLERLRQWGEQNRVTSSASYIIGVVRGGQGIGGVTNHGGELYGDVQPQSVVEDYRPLSATAHEIHHGLGRRHAGLKCGSNDNGQVGEPWPEGDWGYIEGFGLDTSTPSPYKVIDPDRSPLKDNPDTDQNERKYYDLMSYCATGEPNSWISTINWDRAVGFHPPSRRRERPSRVSEAAVGSGPTLEVSAVEASHTFITGVRKSDVGPTAGAAGSPYRLVARDRQGNLIAQAGVVAIDQHVDGPGSFRTLRGRVKAPGAYAVDIVKSGKVVAERLRSAHAPRVRVLSPRKGAKVGGKHPVELRWKATDAEDKRLAVTAEYSRDGGKHWRTVYVGANGGKATIPSLLLAGSLNARLRIVANDGFNDGSATSGRFVSLGSPPQVSIDEPAQGERASLGSSVAFAGKAFDENGRRLAGKRLSWFDGKHLLGRGERIATTGLHAGKRSVRLVARDARGRKSSAAVVVRVTPVQPLFLKLKAPRTLGRTAKRVKLVVAATVPSTLKAGGRKFDVSRRSRTVSVPVATGKKPLKLTLKLVAGGITTRVTLTIPRPK